MAEALACGPSGAAEANQGCPVSSTDSPAEPEIAELGDLSDLADGQLRVYPELGEFGVVVCRVSGKLHAIVDNCSHADTPLSEGRLRGATIVCPLHGAQFDVRTGLHAGPPAWEGVRCYPIDEADDGVRLDLHAPPRSVSSPSCADHSGWEL